MGSIADLPAINPRHKSAKVIPMDVTVRASTIHTEFFELELQICRLYANYLRFPPNTKREKNTIDTKNAFLIFILISFQAE